MRVAFLPVHAATAPAWFRWSLRIALWLLAFGLSGCGLQKVKQRVQQAVVGGEIRGEVTREGGLPDRVMVVVFAPAGNGGMQVIRQIPAGVDGRFRFEVLPGAYYVGAFVDDNGDERHQPDEASVIFGRPTPITIGWKDRRWVRLALGASPPLDTAQENRILWQTRMSENNIGRIVKLDDPVFSAYTGPLGLWRPVDYLKLIGAGLYWLEPYAPDKIPVILVHGANGGPRDWLPLLRTLDRHRYAPWIFTYPSGLRLDVVSDYLESAVARLQARYDVPRFFVVAHSMGGLVALSFVHKWRERHPDLGDRPAFLMTINTPLGGMQSARRGVMYSPIVVPSWKDVASGSRFLQKLESRPWPRTIPWQLVFSYRSDEGSDGVVTLESQLPLHYQYQASRIFGFKATHAGILADAGFLAHLKQSLDRMAARPRSPGRPRQASAFR